MSNEEEPNFKLKRSMQKEQNKSRHETAKMLELTENQINLINELQKQELTVHFDFMQYQLQEKCDKFLETRFCQKFKSCQMFHMDWQRRRPPFQQQDGKYRILQRDIICPNIAAKMKCNLGDLCGFSHNFEEVSQHPCRLKSIICNRKDCRGEWVCAYAHKKDKSKFNYNDVRNHLAEKQKDILIKESRRAEYNEIRFTPIKDRMIVDVKIPSFFKEEYEREKKERKMREELQSNEGNQEEFPGTDKDYQKQDDHKNSIIESTNDDPDLMQEKNSLDITDKQSAKNKDYNDNKQQYDKFSHSKGRDKQNNDFHMGANSHHRESYSQSMSEFQPESQQQGHSQHYQHNTHQNQNTHHSQHHGQGQGQGQWEGHKQVATRSSANMNIISLDHQLRLNPMIQDQKFNMIQTQDIFTPSTFKTKKCEYKLDHDHHKCIQQHNNSERRRKLIITSEEYNKHKYNYTSDLCQSVSNHEQCAQGEGCNQCHTYNELLQHPDNFKKQQCSHFPDVKNCSYGSQCADAHTDSELVGTILHTIIRDERFFKFLFKTIMCPFKHSHDPVKCVYAHSLNEFRRNPAIFKYNPQKCERADTSKTINMQREQGCPDDAFCTQSHSQNEIHYHPDYYKRKECTILDCIDQFCPRMHVVCQLAKPLDELDEKQGKSKQTLMDQEFSNFDLAESNPRPRKSSRDILESNWDQYGDFKEMREKDTDGWEHGDEIADIISHKIDFHKSARGMQGLMRYSMYESKDGFEELLLKYNLLQLKDTIQEMFGSDFITDRTPVDLIILEELHGKMNTAELTDLRAVLSEFNESLMVDQITQNEIDVNNRLDTDGNREKLSINNVLSNNDDNKKQDKNTENDDINR